jgi:hypothetical protein
VVGALMRLGAPQCDAILSARPLAKQLAQMETKPLPVAVFGTRRETEYGLAFYRNQLVSRYESQQIPLGEHLLVAPERAGDAIAKLVGTRRVSYLGQYAPQKLDYYWVAKSGD